MAIIEILKHALMITGFVFIMMLLIEYINVQTRGSWQETLKKTRWGQYVLAALLGAVPGCLGAFTVVSLYSHEVVSFGALVATMIATSGDEAYVMFSLFPVKAFLLTSIIFLIGILAGYLTDRVYKRQAALLSATGHALALHGKDACRCYSREMIVPQLREITFPRALLIGMFVLFLLALLTNSVGPENWNWVKVTLALGNAFALFVVATVPDHFLEQHLWKHVLKKHLLRIFLWTFGALLLIHFLEHYLDVQAWIHANLFTVLIVAVLVGIIPESGPHLLFVTLFARGALPFSILLANSIVQDGHGTLPLIAVSRRGFIYLKLINIVVGFLFGGIGLALGL